MTKRKIYKCPKCGSRNLVPFMGFETGMQYHCLDCDYVGVLRIEEVKKEN
jgi:DNA-directed RNA polymerase subunit RPC12/RpoP